MNDIIQKIANKIKSSPKKYVGGLFAVLLIVSLFAPMTSGFFVNNGMVNRATFAFADEDGLDLGGDSGISDPFTPSDNNSGFDLGDAPASDGGDNAANPVDLVPIPSTDLGGDSGGINLLPMPSEDLGGDSGAPAVDLGGDSGSPAVDLGGDSAGTGTDFNLGLIGAGIIGALILGGGHSNNNASAPAPVAPVVPDAPVCVPATISGSATAQGTVGTPFSYHFNTAGTGPIHLAVGNLPVGLSFNESTRTISGIPQDIDAGLTVTTIYASNDCGSVSLNVNIAILQPGTQCVPGLPVISSALSASATVGTAFSYTITATNNPTLFSADNLPAGLSLNSTTGQISGTPTTAGTYSVTIVATNNCGTAMNVLTITVLPVGGSCTPPAPVITSALSASANTSNAFSYTITASNNPTSFTATNLPAGLTLNTVTGVISGTPTSAGNYNVTITASNACGSVSATLVISVSSPGGGGSCTPPAPVITSGLVTSSLVGSPFLYTITATNNPTSFGFTVLPPGLIGSTTTGVISGTPTSAGTFPITLTATNSCGTGSAIMNFTASNPGSGGGGNPNPPGGGGGGPDLPTVGLSRAGASGLASSFVSLSSVPYTGIGDYAGTIAFLMLVLLISALLSYVSIFQLDEMKKHLAILKKAYATRSIKVLKELKAVNVVIDTKVANIVAEILTPEKLAELIEDTARQIGVLVSKNGIEAIMKAGEYDTVKSIAVLKNVARAYEECVDAECALVITKEKVVEALTDAYKTFVPTVVRWAKNGEKERVANFIATLEKQGIDTKAMFGNSLREAKGKSNTGVAHFPNALVA